MDVLKRIFKADSTGQLIVIFIVFSITGLGAVFLARPLMELVGITRDNIPDLIYWPLRIVFMLLAYQVMLVCFGTVFGQRAYFWRMEKRMLRRFGIRLP
ncbi:MAG: hypothetical protein P8L37_01585 [Phycisphaerales bacterium]|nr:hypothetical protein [Phycisphaerales bacterium]